MSTAKEDNTGVINDDKNADAGNGEDYTGVINDDNTDAWNGENNTGVNNDDNTDARNVEDWYWDDIKQKWFDNNKVKPIRKNYMTNKQQQNWSLGMRRLWNTEKKKLMIEKISIKRDALNTVRNCPCTLCKCRTACTLIPYLLVSYAGVSKIVRRWGGHCRGFLSRGGRQCSSHAFISVSTVYTYKTTI